MSVGRMERCLRAKRMFDEPAKTDDYRQLYLQTKANVQLFIKEVEGQFTQIMAQHRQEKEQLMRENQALRQQLDQVHLRDKGSMSASKWGSDHHIRAFEDCALSDISIAESKSVFSNTGRKKDKAWGLLAQMGNHQKQTEPTVHFSSRSSLSSRDNLENQDNSQLSVLKSRLLACRKAKREQNSIEFPKERVSDVLKKLRFKANNINHAEVMRRKAEEDKDKQPLNILERQMFVPR